VENLWNEDFAAIGAIFGFEVGMLKAKDKGCRAVSPAAALKFVYISIVED
jgi:hypothetical protein